MAPRTGTRSAPRSSTSGARQGRWYRGERAYGRVTWQRHPGPLHRGTTTSSCVAGAFCLHCHAWRGELGQEPSPELYVEHLVAVFRAVKRVLRADGTLWVNLAGCYYNDPGGQNGGPRQHPGLRRTARASPRRPSRPTASGRQKRGRHPWLKPLDWVDVPGLFARAMQQDGWCWRSDVVWVKPSALPESVSRDTVGAVPGEGSGRGGLPARRPRDPRRRPDRRRRTATTASRDGASGRTAPAAQSAPRTRAWCCAGGAGGPRRRMSASSSTPRAPAISTTPRPCGSPSRGEIARLARTSARSERGRRATAGPVPTAPCGQSAATGGEICGTCG